LRSLASLNHYFWKYKYLFFSGLVCIAISNFFAIYPARIVQQLVDSVIDQIQINRLFNGTKHQDALISSSLKIAVYFAVLMLIMALLKGFFMFLMRQTIIIMSRHVEYDQKNAIYAHYQKLHAGFFKTHSTGDLMNRISEDVGRVRMYIGPAIMYLSGLFILFILVIPIMFTTSPKLSLFVLMPLPIMSIAVYLVNSNILKKSEKVQQQLSKISSFVQESFSGIRILKAYNRLSYFAFAFDKETDEYRERNLELVKFNAIFFPLIMLLIGFSTLLTIYVGGIEVSKGNISSGVIAEFIIYVNMLTWPMAMLGWVTSLVQRAAASQIRINEFLQIKPEIVNNNNETYEINGKIEFKDVSFTYPETGIEAIKNLSFKVAPGETLAILGRTGSGKSTVAELLNRFYDPVKGEILVDGKPLTKHNMYLLRKETGYVSQEVFLFSDTIYNNIAFGLHDMNYSAEQEEQMVIQAAKDADVYNNIIGFNEGFQTRIGERGITLSGGQKQRITIARATIKQPRILIFDDCLSAVDTETEEKILKSLVRIMKGKTCLLISHRISTVKMADKIIVLDNGTIAEQGNHTELMNSKGIYFDLYQKQLMEEKKEIV
jgi:ATP-binding cassette subfamily B multidrug efflux pump